MTVATTSSVTTYYPTKYYNVTNGVATKHIFTPSGLLIATVTNATSSGASIGVDATSTSITNGFNSTITKTWTHTTGSGSNRLLTLSGNIWQDVGGTGTITSASYNGVALTKATSTTEVSMDSELWYLVNPASGSNTMSVTVTGNTDAIKLSASTFTGVTQTSPVDINATVIGGSGNPSISATTTVASDLLIATLSRFSTTDATTSRTSLYKDKTGSIFGATSYQLATSAGSYSDTYTGAAAQDWALVMTGFKPAGSSATSTINYILTDHLGGTSAVLDSSGNIQELNDYYPYGNSRLDELSSGTSEVRKAFGHEYDTSTGLIYANARYYNGSNGRFVSQDPVFVNVDALDFTDPQSLNAYAYARNNPLVYTDPSGKSFALLFGSGSALAGLAEIGTAGAAIISSSVVIVGGVLATAISYTVSPLKQGGDNYDSLTAEQKASIIVDPAQTKNAPAISTSKSGSKTGSAAGSEKKTTSGGLGGKAAKDAAADLGYTEKANPGSAGIDTKGKPLFKNPDTGKYISPDRDSHSGGTWKGFDGDGNRTGTYDENLKRIGK